MKWMIGISVISILVSIACGGNQDEVESYTLTFAQAALVIEKVNRNLQPEYKPLEDEEWEIICNNFRNSDWNFDETIKIQRDNDASMRSQVAHGELLVWLWDLDLVNPPNRVAAAPGLVKGFCKNI